MFTPIYKDCSTQGDILENSLIIHSKAYDKTAYYAS